MVRVHVLRNVLIPLVTMVGINLGVALGGVIFIESVFNLPGLGQLFRRSLLQQDLPVTAGIVMVMTLAIMLANLVVDLVYSVLDPRIRTQPSMRYGARPPRLRPRTASGEPASGPAARAARVAPRAAAPAPSRSPRATIDRLIFEPPSTRSTNTIGTSRTRKPLRSARYVVSIWNA